MKSINENGELIIFATQHGYGEFRGVAESFLVGKWKSAKILSTKHLHLTTVFTTNKQLLLADLCYNLLW